MIESDNHDGPEAGPSGWRRTGRGIPRLEDTLSDTVNGRKHSHLSSDDTDTESDSAEVLREEEAEQLENTLSHRAGTPSSVDSNDSTFLLSASRASVLRTPSQLSLRSRPRLRNRISLTNTSIAPSLSHLDLQDTSKALHTSSSEIFQHSSSPPLTRQTTYSSLPPSPRLDATLDFDLTPRKGIGLGVNELERILSHKLEQKDDETFWPARSRRPTIENHERDPTPIAIDSPTPASPEGVMGENIEDATVKESMISLWDLLKDQDAEEEWEGWVVDGKWERITNFLAVPLAMEKVTLFGALLCLDGFLYNFTVLPIRASIASYRSIANLLHHRPVWPIPPSHFQSILRMLLLIIPTAILLMTTDSSKMYHTVRGQDTIKLYVIFNALEIADRLCGAFGQDVLDTLFARETLSPTDRKRGKGRKRQQARPLFFFMLSLGYVLAHTLIFFYMLVSLNVAINSYDYTLLSLLISNQFVEIKGSVFKKFEKENLFQILCADIVERFQLSLMLCVIALRNMIEMSGSEIAFLPKSFMKGKSLIDSIFSPVLFVILSEMMVDWLKHAFISKFNHVRSTVYGRFTDILAKDVLVAGSLTGRTRSRGKNHPVLLDQSPLVARRLGFASIPLACLVTRIACQAIGMLTTSSHHHDDPSSQGYWFVTIRWMAVIGVGISGWACAVALKVLLGLGLLSYSALRRAGMEKREEEDRVNDFGRQPVGESKEETEYNKATTKYLSRVQDELQDYPSPSSIRVPTFGGEGGGEHGEKARDGERGERGERAEKAERGNKGKKWKLEEVERWTMVKRIW